MILLDVAIGLAFVYLMLAVLVSSVHELLANNWAQLRGKKLREGIASLLFGGGGLLQFGESLLEKFYKHPSIDILRDGERLPSYIPKANYAVALADTLVRELGASKPLFAGLPEAVAAMPADSPLKRSLSLLIEQAGNSEARLKALIEAQFDDVMDRVSGWYRRSSQWLMLIIAALLTVALNIDSIHIARRLSADEVLRMKLVAQAELRVSTPVDSNAAAAPVQTQLQELKTLGIPMGWSGDAVQCYVQENNANIYKECDSWGLLLRFFGYILTIIAASLGAPYWFDMLSRLISIRSAGVKPDGKKDEVALPPPALPSEVPLTGSVPAAPARQPELNEFEKTQLLREDIQALQRVLGMPNDQCSGQLDGPTRTAIGNWQKSAGRPANGQLDLDIVHSILYPQGV